MNDWLNYFYPVLLGAALLLCAMGLWFTAIIPGIDRWSKRFFLSYFSFFMLSCIFGIMEAAIPYYNAPNAAMYIVLILESFFLSLPIPMITAYLIHSCGESTKSSLLLHVVTGLWAVYIIMLISTLFINDFVHITPDNNYYRGSLYPIMLIPALSILLINITTVIHRRKQLSRKTYLGFFFALVPMTVAMIVQMFIDVFPLIDMSYILSALAMYSFILSDRIEQDKHRQLEIVRQQEEIANQRASIMVLQMRPHYIYNTLMSIYSLCNIDPKKARQVTMDFTNYLRKNFNAVASENTIPFTAELEHTRSYLSVEQVQYEDMLFVDYDTPFTSFRLPPLTLQPIVENSVKHGIDPYSGPLHISIRTEHTDAGTTITVEDNGPGFNPSDKDTDMDTPHTALTNIQQRLEMMCGGTMTITPREGGGTIVKITIP